MQVVCEATQCSDESVRVAALQNLVKIMSLYYQYMEAYMGPALFAVCIYMMIECVVYNMTSLVPFFLSLSFPSSPLSLIFR